MLIPFSSYRERQTFFRVVTRLKHSSLSSQTVAFWSANMSNFDSSASIEFAVHGDSKMVELIIEQFSFKWVLEDQNQTNDSGQLQRT